MRAVAAALAGAVAALLMAAALPWDTMECARTVCEPSDADAQILLPALYDVIWMGIVVAIVAIIAAAILGLRSSRDPSRLAVMEALGLTRARAVRGAALTGLRDGLITASAVYAAFGITHLLMATSGPAGPFASEAHLWGSRALVAAAAVLALVIAHTADALRASRTPVEALSADARPDEHHRPQLRTRALVVGAALVAAGGTMAGLAISARDTLPGEVGDTTTDAAGVVVVVAWITALAGAFWVALPLVRRGRTVVVEASARAVGHRTATGSVMRAWAHDGSRAAGRVITVLGGIALVVAALASQTSGLAQNPPPVMTITTDSTTPADQMAERYRAIPGVAHVLIAGVVESGYYGTTTVLAVDPEDLRGVADDLADVLSESPSTALVPNPQAQARDVLSRRDLDIDRIVPLDDCCGIIVNERALEGAADGTAFVIFAEPGADRDAVTAAADTIAMEDHDGMAIGVTMSVDAGTQALWAELLSLGVYALIIGVPMAALGAGLVRRRRDDAATLTALGASRRTVGTASVIEVAVTGAYAMGAGMLIGAAIRMAMTALQSARLDIVAVDSGPLLAHAWGSIAWVPVTITAAALLVAVVTGAALAAWRSGAKASTVLAHTAGGRA